MTKRTLLTSFIVTALALATIVGSSYAYNGLAKIIIKGDCNESFPLAGSGGEIFEATSANGGLSNLSGVAINTSLLPGTDNSIDLGSVSYRWQDLYALVGTFTDSGQTSTSTITNDYFRLNAKADYASGTLYLDNNGSIYTSGTIYAPDGSSSAPSITFANDTDTGIYRASGNSIMLYSGAGTYANVNPAGLMVLGAFYPASNNAYDIGLYDYAWNDIFASGTAYLTNIHASGYIEATDSVSSSTISSNFLRINGTSDNASGTLYLDNDGSVYSSGTISLLSNTDTGTTSTMYYSSSTLGNGSIYTQFSNGMCLGQDNSTSTPNITIKLCSEF